MRKPIIKNNNCLKNLEKYIKIKNGEHLPMETIESLLRALAITIIKAGATCEDYCLSLALSNFFVTIEFKNDNFDEIHIYGEIPNNHMLNCIINSEDDEDDYRGVSVKDFEKEFNWNIKNYKIKKL